MNIIADQQIPLIKELFDSFNLITLPANEITKNSIKDAEILLVRSVTPVNANLLAGTQVKFVGTASAGFDHLDIEWLEHQSIIWKHAPGCNAVAVGEYVLSCIAALRCNNVLPQTTIKAGIIGVGNTGSQTLKHLNTLGFDVVCNDPPRAIRDIDFHSDSLHAFYDCDLICLHLPLVQSKENATYHLINHSFLKNIKPGCIILNAGRGSTIDENAVLANDHLKYCFDVWENEPSINLNVLERCIIATPHIAGHSIEAKSRATIQLYQELRNYYAIPELSKKFHSLLKNEGFNFKNVLQKEKWEKELLSFFDPTQLSLQFKSELLSLPQMNYSQKLKILIAERFNNVRRSHYRHEISFSEFNEK